MIRKTKSNKEVSVCLCLGERKRSTMETKKKVAGNRTFLRTVKSFLSNKSIENEKIILVEKEEIHMNDSSVAKVLNNLLSKHFLNTRNFGLHA